MSTKVWREEHKTYKSNYDKIYRQNNRDKLNKVNANWYKTQNGKAHSLINNYKRDDKKYNRGECTLTAKWIVDNIFSSKCVYCGKNDWTELGCDRINNDLPHTPDNVVCCCKYCNKKRGEMSYESFLKLTNLK